MKEYRDLQHFYKFKSMLSKRFVKNNKRVLNGLEAMLLKALKK
jgi:hypothetical protein